MKMSEQGIGLLKSFEGFRAYAYKCPAGIWTIGWGHTEGVTRGQRCTQEQAEEWLRRDIAWAECSAAKYLPGATQNQFDAVVSFIFNLGTLAFANSNLRRRILAGAPDAEIREQWMKWNKAKVNGTLTALEGLTRRRAAEADVYLEGRYPENETNN